MHPHAVSRRQVSRRTSVARPPFRSKAAPFTCAMAWHKRPALSRHARTATMHPSHIRRCGANATTETTR